jgi:hypothetical protein
MKYNLYFSDNESLMEKVKELIEANVVFEVSTLKISILKRPNANILYKTKEGSYKDIDVYSEYSDIKEIATHLYEIEEVQKLIQNECEILGILKKSMCSTTVK